MITYFFGGWDIAVITLLVFVIMDYVSGIICAVCFKELSSKEGFKGLAKKMFIIIILAVAVLLDRLMNNGAFIFRTLVCYFYIANEGLSILENAIRLGLPVPEKIHSVLAQLFDSNPKKSKNNNKTE